MAQEKGFTVDMLDLKRRWKNNKSNQAKKQLMNLINLIPDQSKLNLPDIMN